MSSIDCLAVDKGPPRLHPGDTLGDVGVTHRMEDMQSPMNSIDCCGSTGGGGGGLGFWLGWSLMAVVWGIPMFTRTTRQPAATAAHLWTGQDTHKYCGKHTHTVLDTLSLCVID